MGRTERDLAVRLLSVPSLFCGVGARNKALVSAAFRHRIACQRGPFNVAGKSNRYACRSRASRRLRERAESFPGSGLGFTAGLLRAGFIPISGKCSNRALLRRTRYRHYLSTPLAGVGFAGERSRFGPVYDGVVQADGDFKQQLFVVGGLAQFAAR